MKIVRVTAEGGDWEGLYVDGVLKAEEHSLTSWHVLEALGLEYEDIEVGDPLLVWTLGRLPLGIGELRHLIEKGKNGDHARWEDEGGSVVG